MDAETMRRILAELAMGWTRRPYLITECREAYWLVQKSLHPAYEKMIPVSKWHPDTDWSQCGLVIEAMRAKGWNWRIDHDEDGTRWMARCIMPKPQQEPKRVFGYGSTFCEAVSLAAARALEATDE